MKMSEKGLELLSTWEGVETKVYVDAAGLETIGVGHLLTESEKSSQEIVIGGEPVRYADGLTEKQVMELLGQDLERFEAAVNDGVTVALNQDQLRHPFIEKVNRSFNVGVGAFSSSTLRRVLNEGHYDQVPAQLARWNKAGGKVLQGLVNRRQHEIDLWNGKL